MAIYNLYSKRLADAAKVGSADVYQYDDIPQHLRVQVKNISLKALGNTKPENELWANLESTFLHEKGRVSIGSDYFAGTRTLAYMLECPTAEWLDLLELVAIAIKVMGGKSHFHRQNFEVSMKPADAINEINYRMREAGVGYQIIGGGTKTPQITRVDSQYLHAEVVKPALAILAGEGFEGPREEFLSAHRHYRAGENRQAISSAANAVESTFKAIFDQKGWEYPKGAPISGLVKVGRENGLWPDYLDKSFEQLVAILKSGLPEIRNNAAAHGQGSMPANVPDYIAAYALHLTASNIVFIAAAAE